MGLAYLSLGKMFVKEGDEASRQVDSKFGASVRQRAMELQRRHSWKTQGRGAQFMRGGALWGATPETSELPVSINGISRGFSDGELFYSLITPEISGLFAVRDGLKEEQRLLHTSDFWVREICASKSAQKLAFVMAHRDGTSSIAVIGANGDDMAEVTQGDSVDQAPSWVPGSATVILFQSAGIGRNQAGIAVGRGPFLVEKLNLEDGSIQTVAEEDGFDLLVPRQASDGSLWFIKRPYTPPNAKAHPFKVLLDFALFPFRLLFAVFQFLNFFSAKYTGKFLVTQGGARQREADVRQMMIWGNMIEAAKQGGNDDEETPALVPGNWQLVRQKPDGTREAVANGVVSFDLEADGSVVYSNGRAIYRRSDTGESTRLDRGEFILQVVSF
ncbi:MAG TPA: hypothetical protein VF786_05340 [Terriglobales bacterium]